MRKNFLRQFFVVNIFFTSCKFFYFIFCKSFKGLWIWSNSAHFAKALYFLFHHFSNDYFLIAPNCLSPYSLIASNCSSFLPSMFFNLFKTSYFLSFSSNPLLKKIFQWRIIKFSLFNSTWFILLNFSISNVNLICYCHFCKKETDFS